jgi:hypothetical protein
MGHLDNGDGGVVKIENFVTNHLEHRGKGFDHDFSVRVLSLMADEVAARTS